MGNFILKFFRTLTKYPFMQSCKFFNQFKTIICVARAYIHENKIIVAAALHKSSLLAHQIKTLLWKFLKKIHLFLDQTFYSIILKSQS